MDSQIINELRLLALLRNLPYKTTLITEMSQDGMVNNFLKIMLSVEDLQFSNWFDFEKSEMLLAESDTSPIVSLRGCKYLKTYTILVEKPRNEYERQFGRKHININKGIFSHGLCYKVRKVYPRPIFLPSMYQVNFSNLGGITRTLTQAVMNIDDKIKSSMIEISFHVENENLIAQLHIDYHGLIS